MQIFRHPPESQVRRLLAAAQLPLDDLTPRHLEHFFACGSAQAPLGVGGVELFEADALLRSLAIDEHARGQGCGRALVAALERHAHERGARRVYLLTTTAARFFEGLGYRVIAREEAPARIRATPEYSELCPSSAAFMVKDLG